VSKSTPTIIITHSVLLRQGIASLLQVTSYKVISIAAEPAELPIHCCPKGQRALAIFGIDRRANLAGTADRVHLLRALMPDGKLVLLVETDGSIDPWLMAELCPDACIFDLGSRDALIRILELTFMDHRVFVFRKEAHVTTAKESLALKLAPSGKASLSSREQEILSYLAEGKSNKAIGLLCNLSDATVKVHLKSILRKTNTLNRTQAALWAIGHGVGNHAFERADTLCDASALAPAGTSAKTEGV